MASPSASERRQSEPGESGATARTQPRNRKAKGTPLLFPIEALNRWRPIRNRPEDVTFVENWRAVPGAREAECAHGDVLKSTDLHELQPGEDGRRFIVVPGSHSGGAALADSVAARLSDFLRVVVNDERWATARSHEAVHTLAEAAFFTQEALQAILNAFELANKGPGLSAAEKRHLDQAVKTAEEVVQRLARSEQFKAWIAEQKDHLDEANQVRAENARALDELVAQLDREHPDWSHVEMAKKLEADKVLHMDGKPYTARRIGQIRNEQRAAHRKSGR